MLLINSIFKGIIILYLSSQVQTKGPEKSIWVLRNDMSFEDIQEMDRDSWEKNPKLQKYDSTTRPKDDFIDKDGYVKLAIILPKELPKDPVIVMGSSSCKMFHEETFKLIANFDFFQPSSDRLGIIDNRKVAFKIPAYSKVLFLKVRKNRNYQKRDNLEILSRYEFQTKLDREYIVNFLIVGILLVCSLILFYHGVFLQEKALRTFSFFNISVILLFLHLENLSSWIYLSLLHPDWYERFLLSGDYLLTFFVYGLFIRFSRQFLKTKQIKAFRKVNAVAMGLVILLWIYCLAAILFLVSFENIDRFEEYKASIKLGFNVYILIITFFVLGFATHIPFKLIQFKPREKENAIAYLLSTWVLGLAAIIHALKELGIPIFDGGIQPIDIGITLQPTVLAILIIRKLFKSRKEIQKILQQSRREQQMKINELKAEILKLIENRKVEEVIAEIFMSKGEAVETHSYQARSTFLINFFQKVYKLHKI